ncbi:hypothetical protein ACJJTC_007445 [Scirpophaga incertulas]
MCSQSPLFRQAWTVSGVLLGITTGGFHLGFTSSLLPALKQPDSPIQIDLTTASWLVSSIGPSTLIGFFISSFLMTWTGRRNVFILISVPATLSWLLIYLAPNVAMLIAGRICGGIAMGGTVILGAVMIGEYTSPKYRGMFLNFKTTAICLGSMIVHILDYYFHWKTIALVGFIVQLTSVSIAFRIPDSPHWLASKGKYQKSKEVFHWLRGEDEQAKYEISELIKGQQEIPMVKQQSILMVIKGFFKKFRQADFVKPTIVILFSFILLESTGRHFFPAYASQIMEKITGSKGNTSFYTLGMDITITSSTLVSCFLVRLMKRRTLLFTTGFAAVILSFAASISVYMISNGYLSLNLWPISVSLFVLYFVIVNLGCTPIPLALLGEVYPLEHRAAGSSAAGVVMSGALWLTMKSFPYIFEKTHIYGTFGIFGMIELVMLIILYFILPETKDKTLEEIQTYFNVGSFKKVESKLDESKVMIEKC